MLGKVFLFFGIIWFLVMLYCPNLNVNETVGNEKGGAKTKDVATESTVGVSANLQKELLLEYRRSLGEHGMDALERWPVDLPWGDETGTATAMRNMAA